MQIISNTAAIFEKHKVNTLEDGTRLAELIDSIQVNPSPYPQIVPDWVKDNDLYKLMIRDGSAVEVNYGQSDKVAQVPATPIKETKPTQPATKLAEIVKPQPSKQVEAAGFQN